MPTFQLDRRGFLHGGSGAFAAAALAVGPEPATARISVDPAPMQRFDGFGLSQPLGDTAFAALSPAAQAKGSTLSTAACRSTSSGRGFAAMPRWT